MLCWLTLPSICSINRCFCDICFSSVASCFETVIISHLYLLTASCDFPAVFYPGFHVVQNGVLCRSRREVGNLFGCYISGVNSSRLNYRNRVNGYKGKSAPVQHFDLLVRSYLRHMGKQEHIIYRLHQLHQAVERISGAVFHSSSVLLTYDESKPAQENLADIHFIDFERFSFSAERSTPDQHLLRSLRHLLYIMRSEWIGPVPTVYLIRHGERYDYTDPTWAPQSSRHGQSWP